MSNTNASDFIKKITVNINIQSPDSESKVINSKIGICYYKDYTLFEIPILYISTAFESDCLENFKELLSSERRGFKYFIFKSNSAQGLAYDSLAQEKGEHFSVDILLRQKTIPASLFSRQASDNPVESIKRSKEDYTVLIEVFSRTASINGISEDTLIYHYTNNLKDIPYSFSRTLDQQGKGKVHKIEHLYHAKLTNAANPNSILKMKATYEIIENKDVDSSIIEYYNKFINEFSCGTSHF